MESVKLTNTDLVISRLGFGSEPLGGTDWGPVDESVVMAAVSRALELGINFFDTADVYGLGRSEQLLSKALGQRRHDVIIASKFGVNWEANRIGGRAKTFFDSSPDRVVEALENSLRRLRIDTIPLYFIHWPDPNTPLVDTMEALVKCREAGKIKYIGVSNFGPDQVREANQIVGLAAVQLQYSLVDHRAEQELLPICRELGVSVLAYGSLAQGLLTGKYNVGTRFNQDDRRHRLPHFQGNNLIENLKIVDRLKEVGKRYHKSETQVALRWVLENSAISGIITGAKTPAQIEHNTGALGWHLTQEDYQYIRNATSKPKPNRADQSE
jgi:aryl-alcohol dehydrogenase-like predicted oxidoreductase